MNHDMEITSDVTLVDWESQEVRRVQMRCVDCDAVITLSTTPARDAADLIDLIANRHAFSPGDFGVRSVDDSESDSPNSSAGSSTVSIGRNSTPNLGGSLSSQSQSTSSS